LGAANRRQVQNPRGSEEPAIDFHGGLALGWEAKYSSRASFRSREKLLAALLRDTVEVGAIWLDAGCGTGHFSRQIATLGAFVTGLDGATEMIVTAQRLGGGADGARLVYRTCSDLTCLPEQAESFDGVLCSSVLEYLDEPTRLLDEFWRVTRPGGSLIVTLPNRWALVRKAQHFLLAVTSALRHPYPRYLEHVKGEWTAREAIALLSKAGFDVRSVAIGGLGWGPSWLDRQALWGTLLFILATRLPEKTRAA
jgi:2-polyprenyl-3-methyl-5-hydroxy-6-metoxy-1,4-benzoquinol methylase